ncbi:hypothetical protein F4809DRAFT_250804 [Biscogniauxia mediterranea]|nr:hypothetical protein F4809DRAFT_250804 [Biscogniauxia mediterranea]
MRYCMYITTYRTYLLVPTHSLLIPTYYLFTLLLSLSTFTVTIYTHTLTHSKSLTPSSVSIPFLLLLPSPPSSPPPPSTPLHSPFPLTPIITIDKHGYYTTLNELPATRSTSGMIIDITGLIRETRACEETGWQMPPALQCRRLLLLLLLLLNLAHFASPDRRALQLIVPNAGKRNEHVPTSHHHLAPLLGTPGHAYPKRNYTVPMYHHRDEESGRDC